MPEEIFVLSLAAIVFGTSLVGFVLWNIFSLIKAKINKGNKSPGEINPQFFKALSEFKKNTERRLTNLEAIVTDLEEEKYLVEEEAESTGDIEIEEENIRSASEEDKEKGGNLRNMLNE